MARIPVLPEATFVGALSAQLRRKAAVCYVRNTSKPDWVLTLKRWAIRICL